MSLLSSPSSSHVPSPQRRTLSPAKPVPSAVLSTSNTTPVKTTYRNVGYLFDETGKITNFNERDLMRGNKASKMANTDNTGLKKSRELQYFLPYSISNMETVKKYGDRPFYYYKPKDVVVYYLPLLKKQLSGISNLSQDDFDENWYRTKISDNESTDTLFFTRIRDICQANKLEIDGVYSPESRGMHEEVILFDPRKLMRQSRLIIPPLFKLFG